MNFHGFSSRLFTSLFTSFMQSIVSSYVKGKSSIAPESFFHETFDLRFRKVETSSATARQLECERQWNSVFTRHVIIRHTVSCAQYVDAVSNDIFFASRLSDSISEQKPDSLMILPV